ncbi:MAG: rod shape-determining protein MreC [Aquificaceae bacterium]|nr:rod shape-determining protein MreC [Aquificaceae bacterium]
MTFFLLVLSLLLYFADLSTLPYLNRFYELLRHLVQPIFRVKGELQERTERAIKTYVYLKGVSEENQRLRRELERYALYQSQLRTCESKLMLLQKTLDLPYQPGEYPVLYAQVIAYDPSGNDTFFLINKGQEAGLEEGMIVSYGDYLVGILDRVYVGSSRVRTVYARDFSVSASVGGKAYIYRGGYPEGYLLHVHVEDDLREGDVVLLRVPEKNLPQLTIGAVKATSQEGKSFFKKVQVKPSADVRRVSFCVVIKEKL